MGSATFELFRRAIEAKQQIRCNYDGYDRLVCPHAVGFSKAGIEMALAFQFAGGSSSGLPPGGEWRCFELSRVHRARARDGGWHTGPIPRHPQTCVHRIVAEAAQ